MRREVHVRFCERLAVTFRGPTLRVLQKHTDREFIMN